MVYQLISLLLICHVGVGVSYQRVSISSCLMWFVSIRSRPEIFVSAQVVAKERTACFSCGSDHSHPAWSSLYRLLALTRWNNRRFWKWRKSSVVERWKWTWWGVVGTVGIKSQIKHLCSISNTKDLVWPHFQTPRRELKIRRAGEYFWRTLRTLRCLEM